MIAMKIEGAELWVIPWGLAALAEIALEAGNAKDAKDYFHRAKKYVETKSKTQTTTQHTKQKTTTHI